MAGGAIERVVILGGGTAGWMAAAALSRALKNSGIAIDLIESDEIGVIGVGEATVPDIRRFNDYLGVDEADFMRQCRATFKLGIEFLDWGAVGRRYMHPFTHYGVDPGQRQFQRLYLKHALAGQASGVATSFDDYNLASIAARAGRFCLSPKTQLSAAGTLNYAFHFDAVLYARFLRNIAERHGVRRIEGKVVCVGQDKDSGFIQSTTLAGGSVVRGDFYIDCSGFTGVLIEGALGTGYEEWGHWLPCNRAIALPTASVHPPAPYTRSTADVAGWIWRIPLQHRVGNGYVYSSRHISDEEAEVRLMSRVDGAPLAEPRRIQFVTGKRKRVWNGNCLALGLAAGFLEPLESTSIHLIQTSLLRLISYFPDKGFEPVEIDAFNQQTDEEYGDIRDFLITHYKLTSRDDTPFWTECRDMDVPDRVRAIIDLFAAKGRLTLRPEQLFTTQSWLAILLGQTELPRGCDPLLAAMPQERLEQEMSHVRLQLNAVVRTMPQHAQFVREYCESAKAMA